MEDISVSTSDEFIHLPVLYPSPKPPAIARHTNAIAPVTPNTAWRHRLYRIPVQPQGSEFAYSSDGHKKLRPAQGQHIDLYV
jgi:hypothetical protein